MTTIEFLKDVRFGGGRFWRTLPDHGWCLWSYRDLDQAMRVECGVTSAEARRELETVKRNSVIDDADLRKEIQWFRWTRGQRVQFILGYYVFFNRAGWETRRMTLEQFDKEYQRRIGARGGSTCDSDCRSAG